MIRILFLVYFLIGTSSFSQSLDKPNIVYVICDDLGYGDVQFLNPENSKIPTPHVDRLASEGMTFTDAHSGSSVCTPTRYGVMTGRYSWRTKLQSGVVQGFAPCLISQDRPTVAAFLQENGYHTAIIGKWHLNFRYLDPTSGDEYVRGEYKSPPVGAKIPDGPIHRGFDYFHGFHHARNMEAVIINDKVVKHEDPIHMLPRLTRESVKYIESRKDKKEPFFLYVPLGSPHTPILPTKKWQGKSGLGAYGDFVMETDHVMGEIRKVLKATDQDRNTLVIFTSDNGCSKAAGIPELAKKGHKVSAHLRGSKADLWDGGHRIPFIVKWPGKVKEGSQSEELICLTDLYATVADILSVDSPKNSCEDSVSFLPALYGEQIMSSRKGVIHHSISGHFAYRMDNWKLLLAKASGGWSSPKENQVKSGALPAQLYDMSKDIEEQKNLFSEKSSIVQELLSHLKEDVESGRSTNGPKSGNDVEDIVLWKSEKKKSLK